MKEILNRRYEFKPCKEIYERLRNQIYEFYKVNGVRPKLILGYGTYLSLCLIETKFALPDPAISNRILEIEEFEGCPITIDPAYEFRIQLVSRTNQNNWNAAIDAFIKSDRP